MSEVYIICDLQNHENFIPKCLFKKKSLNLKIFNSQRILGYAV